jgi:hypothetical protein
MPTGPQKLQPQPERPFATHPLVKQTSAKAPSNTPLLSKRRNMADPARD